MIAAKAKINRDILIWAREESGYSEEELAKKIQVKPERITAWQDGADLPTMPQLRKLAKVLKRSPAVFYLDKVPEHSQVLPDFRSHPEDNKISALSLYYIRLTKIRREYAIELADELEEIPNTDFPVGKISDNPEKTAQNIRDYFSLSFDLQIKSRTTDNFYKECQKGIENRDILIFQTERVPLGEFRGLSITDMPFPAILVNGDDAPAGRIFTLFHEVGHILLQTSGICNMETDDLPKNEIEIEKWCNHFAGALLCPEREFKNYILNNLPKQNEITSNEINSFARSFNVSRETVARRLYHFDYITQSQYLKFRQNFHTEWLKYKKEKKKDSGFAPYKYRVLNQNGRNYSLRVFEALHNEHISPFEASNYLNVKPKHLETLAVTLFKG